MGGVSAPLRPHSLSRAPLSQDAPLGFVPCPAAVICSGPGSGDKRGTKGLDWGSTDPFQDGEGSSLSPVSLCHLLLPNRWLMSCIFLCAIPQKQYGMCGLGIELANAHFTSEHTPALSHKHTLSRYTDTVPPLQALLSKPTHWIVSGTALPSRQCVGGTEPQALSVSIAHVKSHVGCDEPPTIPGTITWRNRGRGSFRRPPRIAAWHRMLWLSSC